MKLVELLARELDVWADTTHCYAQDPCCTVYPWTGMPGNDGKWLGFGGAHVDQNNEAPMLSADELADDHSTAIITRADWQAERERIAGGWIAWGGGECPVADGVDVDYMMRGGVENTDVDGVTSDRLRWDHRGTSGDIIAYRPRKPEQASGEAIDAGIAAADAGQVKPIEEVKSMYEYNPIHTRDRITTIDFDIHSLTVERAALVHRLADEGFVLARVDGKVAPGQPEEDMADCLNWKRGDVVRANGDSGGFRTGNLYVLREDCTSRDHSIKIAKDDNGEENGWGERFFVWHSRPTA